MAVIESKAPLLVPSGMERLEAPLPRESRGGRGSVSRALLRLPLFYKLVIANGAIALVAVLACATFVATAVRADPGAETATIILPVVVAAIALGIVINAAVVGLALTPLRNLEKAAEEVRAGSETARALESAVSDAGIERVVQTFNAMLDSVAVYRKRLREIAVRALDAGESERKRISRELHDNVAQSLAAILVQLRIARSGATPEQAAQLADIAEQLGKTIDELRGLAQELRPPALDMLGLGAAVLAHARKITETTGVKVDARIDGILDGALTPESELAVYRLVQEALLNVVRHGQTSEARTELRREASSVIAEVSDFGRGFEVDRTIAGGALGLLGMYERAQYVGGRVEVRSTPGRGTTVRIEIPLKDQKTGGTIRV